MSPMTKVVRTHVATIWVGTKVRETGEVHGLDVLRRVCQDYCDRVGLCVTLTPTEFIYTNGGEPGVAVGLINYARFPSSRLDIRDEALELAELLGKATGQLRVSVVMHGAHSRWRGNDDMTYMLSMQEPELDEYDVHGWEGVVG